MTGDPAPILDKSERDALLDELDRELRGIVNEPRFLVENRAERRARERKQRRRTK